MAEFKITLKQVKYGPRVPTCAVCGHTLSREILLELELDKDFVACPGGDHLLRVTPESRGSGVELERIVAEVMGDLQDAERLHELLHGQAVSRVTDGAPSRLRWEVSAEMRSNAWEPVEFEYAAEHESDVTHVQEDGSLFVAFEVSDRHPFFCPRCGAQQVGIGSHCGSCLKPFPVADEASIGLGEIDGGGERDPVARHGPATAGRSGSRSSASS